MSLEIERAVLAALEAGRPAVVATVLTHRGSSPGKRHQKLLFLGTDETLGSVGGGVVEAEVLRLCAAALVSGEGGAHRFSVTETGENAVGGVCGGQLEVAIEVLGP